MLRKIGKIIFSVKRYHFISLIFIFLIYENIFATDIKAELDKYTAYQGEAITLSVTINGDGFSEPVLPHLPDFDKAGAGVSTQVSIINGTMSRSKTYRYTLIAHKPGKYTIGSIYATKGNQKISTKPLDIEILQGSPPQGSRQQQNIISVDPFNFFGNTQQSQIKVFIIPTISSKRLYKNQQAIVEYNLYFTRGMRITELSPERMPSFTGFWTEDVKYKAKYREARINNTTYTHVIFLKKIVIPTKSGDLKIGSASFIVSFDSFFSMFGQRVKVKAPEIKVKVLDLPQPIPPDFSGDVGQYSIKTKINSKKVKQNSPITLKIIISGIGNIKTITPPSLPELTAFKVWSSKKDIEQSISGKKISGKKILEYMLVPKQAGKLTIPALSYTYFDPASKKYKTRHTSAIQLEVSPYKGKDEEYSAILSKSEIEKLNSDIRYIHDVKKLTKASIYYFKRGSFWGLVALFTLLYAILFGYMLYLKKLKSDIGFARATRAFKIANKRLKNIKTEKGKEVFSDLHDILLEYVADRLNISKQGIVIDELLNLLKEKNVPDAMLNKLKNMDEELNMIRYAPTDISTSPKDTKLLLKNYIQDFEKIKLI